MIRNGEIYVSWSTRQGLAYAALKLSGDDTKMTADSVAEDVLSRWLAEQHPDIAAHVESRAKADAEFKQGLVRKRGT